MKLTGLKLEKNDTLTIKFDGWLASLCVAATDDEIVISARDVRFYGDRQIVMRLPNRTKPTTGG